MIARRPNIKFDIKLDRFWCNGDPFLTSLFNALSMLFPTGEKFFIDSVRSGMHQLKETPPHITQEIQTFIQQESHHSMLHKKFNTQLEEQGLDNRWEKTAKSRVSFLSMSNDPKPALAITAAGEHLTAVLGQWLLKNHHILGNTKQDLQRFWLWHSAEELEHRSTAFNLLSELGADHKYRSLWGRRVIFFFSIDLARQTALNLRKTGDLWKIKTLLSAIKIMFGKNGLISNNITPILQYHQKGYHPKTIDPSIGIEWIEANSDFFIKENQ